MGKGLRLEDKGEQEQSGRPPAGTAVNIAVDLSRSKWVYCVRLAGNGRAAPRHRGQVNRVRC